MTRRQPQMALVVFKHGINPVARQPLCNRKVPELLAVVAADTGHRAEPEIAILVL